MYVCHCPPLSVWIKGGCVLIDIKVWTSITKSGVGQEISWGSCSWICFCWHYRYFLFYSWKRNKPTHVSLKQYNNSIHATPHSILSPKLIIYLPPSALLLLRKLGFQFIAGSLNVCGSKHYTLTLLLRLSSGCWDNCHKKKSPSSSFCTQKLERGQ